MKVKELGEFDLIVRLRNRVAKAKIPDGASFALMLGIGDDSAAWHTQTAVELITTDTLVEGVHFTLETASWEDLGWKALAVNLSDIAAMGGLPLYSLVTLGLPADTEVEGVEALYDGLLECATQWGGRIVGGDLVRAPVLFITVALTGTTQGQPLVRSAAKPGEQVAVTGTLGASNAGLVMLRRRDKLEPNVASALCQAHFRPDPRLMEGQRLLAGGVRCAMDISDGLVADLSKLCQASGVAAWLESNRVPIHSAVRRAFPRECLEMALSGGEEYELLFTAPPETMDRLTDQLPSGATIIGEIIEGPAGQVTVLDAQGGEMTVSSGGWDHFQT